MHAVTFNGVNRTLQADDGENLLTLAQRNGLHIDSSCGGNGSCHQCRVLIHDGRENFRRAGKACEPRHKLGVEPVYLACQGGVFGDMTVEPAPVRALGDRPNASLIGWSAGGTPRSSVIIDPGSYTGAAYQLDDDGNFIAEEGFATQQAPAPTPGQVVLGEDVTYADALSAGTSHLPDSRRIVLDFAGRIAACVGDSVELHAVPTNAFIGNMPHVAGAIDSVQWSPLKTRTVITTVDGKAPAGLCAAGLLSCVHALMQAGMCNSDLQLLESRFTTRVNGQLAALLVSSNVEAQSPHGQIYLSENAIVVSQSQLNVIRDAAKMLCQRLDALDADSLLVVTGDFGTYVPTDLIRALGVHDGEIEFVPHAAALGAARLTVSASGR
ncbi:MAG: DUF4445 domain-containing protein [Planctomycetes bacterium]|nr:DUF4445 domain-containing protein [Planctomycetota bacterium]